MEQLMKETSGKEPAEDSGKDPYEDKIEKTVQHVFDSALWSQMTLDEQISDVVERIHDNTDDVDISDVLEPDCEDEERAWRVGDSLRTAMTIIRPALERMTYAESKQAISEIADRIRQTGLDSQSYIAVGRADDGEEEDPRELGRRIMRKRNANYKPEEEK
ncbi:MAG: hypothetical protein IJK06_00355 [Clostridia bacterium]|nr:hypothetical protein [Clostridia bacterium]